MATAFQTFFISYELNGELGEIRIRARSRYEAKQRAAKLIPKESLLKGMRTLATKKKHRPRIYPK